MKPLFKNRLLRRKPLVKNWLGVACLGINSRATLSLQLHHSCVTSGSHAMQLP